MSFLRIIPSLLIQNKKLVKGFNFSKYKNAGIPKTTIQAFDSQKCDEIILIDFGVARNLYDKKIIVTDEDMGTLGYMCEELGFGMCSKKSDIFSLGVCILELWVGEIWQEGSTYEDCRKEVLNSLKYLESKEKELGKIIRKCVLKNPTKRPYIQTVLKNLSKIV